MTRLERKVARPWKGRAILCSQCFRELFPDLCESVADEERTALVAGDAGGHIGGVMAARLGFDRTQTMAFGDGLNDITLLKAAGTGVAMGNAHPDVKKIADRVTADCDHDGVALVINGLLI